ncbi:MAG: hypothetical protein AB1497_00835 [Bacillota bacterium]
MEGKFNISTGAILTLYEELCSITGFSGQPAFEPRRPGDLSRSALSGALAREQLGFVPKVSLDSGLLLTFDSIKASLGKTE